MYVYAMYNAYLQPLQRNLVNNIAECFFYAINLQTEFISTKEADV